MKIVHTLADLRSLADRVSAYYQAQGYFVAFFKIPSFIVTLAGMLVFKGLALALLKTTPALPLLLSLATGIVVGAGAAWRLTRTNVSDALKQGLSRTDADYSGTRTRNALVVAEVALSLMLLVCHLKIQRAILIGIFAFYRFQIRSGTETRP